MRADSEKSMLFYITHNHTLNSSTYNGVQWITGLDLGIQATAPNSRQLSVTSVGDSSYLTAKAPPDILLLFYESPGGNITALLGSHYLSNSSSCVSLQVMDISNRKSLALPPYISNVDCSMSGITSLPEATGDYRNRSTLYGSRPEATFSVPFTSAQFSDNSTQLMVQALFYAPSTSSILSSVYLHDVVQQGLDTGVHKLSIFIVVKRLILFVRYKSILMVLLIMALLSAIRIWRSLAPLTAPFGSITHSRRL